MVRRAALAIAALLLLIAAIAGGLYLGRVPVAQAVLDNRLSALGLPEAHATVVEVEFDHMRLRDLAAGRDREFAAKALSLDFRLADLLDGKVARIEVEGLALRLDLREDAALFGSLQAPTDRMAARRGPSGPVGPPARLPEISVADARISAETPLGPATLAVDGSVTYYDPRVASTSFDLVLDAPFGRLEVRLKAGGDPRLRLDGEIEVFGRDLNLPKAEARVSSLRGVTRIVVTNGRPYSGQGKLVVSGLSIAGTPFEGAGLDFELSENRATARGRLLEARESFRFDFDGAIEDLRGQPRLSLTLDSEFFERSALWTLARPSWPQSGEGRLSASIEGNLSPRDSVPGDPPSLLAWLREGALNGAFEIDLDRLGFAPPVPGLAARLRGTADWSEGRLEVSLSEDGLLRTADFTAADLAAADLTARGLPAPLAEQLASLAGDGLSLTLASAGARPARVIWRPSARTGDGGAGALTVEGSVELTGDRLDASASGRVSAALGDGAGIDGAGIDSIALDAFAVEVRDFSLAGQTFAALGLAGTLEGTPGALEARTEVRARLRRPSLGEWRAEEARLTLPLRISRRNGRLDAALTAPGRLVAEGLRGRGVLEAVGPLELTLEEISLTIEPTAGDAAAPSFQHHGRLSLAPTRFRLLRAEEEPLAIAARLPKISWAASGQSDARFRVEASLSDGRIDLPDREVALDGLSATAVLPEGGKGAAVDFAVAEIRHLGAPELFAPYQLSGRVEHKGETVELRAEARRPDDLGRVAIAGRHDVASGAGTLDLTLAPLTFAAGGAQPAQLLPALSVLSEVRGTAAGQARLRWDARGGGGTADLSLAGLSFQAGDTAVEALDLALRLEPLWPLASPAGQRLTVGRIDAGLPLEDLSVSFRLPVGPPGRVLVEQASFAAAGARFAIGETLIDPGADRNQVRLLVEDLDLAVLFGTLDVEGLSGEGRLSGAIPVAWDGEHLLIAEARLSSAAPGVLRFSSDSAARALRSGGASVDLLLQALRNFQFDTLALTGNLGPANDAQLRLELLGRNPDVLDGHPFQINVNLTGNAGPLAEALRQGRAITRDLLRRSWRLTP